jgi:hypothetical protein
MHRNHPSARSIGKPQREIYARTSYQSRLARFIPGRHLQKCDDFGSLIIATTAYIGSCISEDTRREGGGKATVNTAQKSQLQFITTAQELHESAEQPALFSAHAGRLSAKSSYSGCSS